MKIYDMKVNHLTSPLGFRMKRTVFSWKVSEASGRHQKDARIVVAADPEMQNVVYDSGCCTKYDRSDLPEGIISHLHILPQSANNTSMRSNSSKLKLGGYDESVQQSSHQ